MTWQWISPGTWVIFAVIGLPVYTVLLSWFLGSPRDTKKALMGVYYLIGFIASLWFGLFALTMVIRFVFPPAM